MFLFQQASLSFPLLQLCCPSCTWLGTWPSWKETQQNKRGLCSFGFLRGSFLLWFILLPQSTLDEALQVQGCAHSQVGHSLSHSCTEAFGLWLENNFCLWLGFTSYTLQAFFFSLLPQASCQYIPYCTVSTRSFNFLCLGLCLLCPTATVLLPRSLRTGQDRAVSV